MARREDGPDDPEIAKRDRSETPSENVTDLRRERTYRLERPTVDPEKFFTRARDDHGHSEWIRVRLLPETYDQLSSIVGKRSPFGYRTFSAFARDAIIHRLGYLTDKHGTDEERASFAVFLADEEFAEIAAAEEHARRWVQQVRDQMDSIVFDYTERNQLPIALEKLRHWLGRLPGYEEAHHVYIQQYILAKMAEVRKAILDQRGNSSHS